MQVLVLAAIAACISAGAEGSVLRHERGIADWWQRFRDAVRGVTQRPDNDLLQPGTVFEGAFVDPTQTWNPELATVDSDAFKKAYNNYTTWFSTCVTAGSVDGFGGSMGYQLRVLAFAPSLKFGGIEVTYRVTITQMFGGTPNPSKAKFRRAMLDSIKRFSWIEV